MDLPSLRDPDFARPFALVCLIVTAVVLAVATVVYLFPLVLLLVLSCVLADLFTTIAGPFERHLPGPRWIWVTLAFVVVLAAFSGLVGLLLVPLIEQGQNLVEEIPHWIARIERAVQGTGASTTAHAGTVKDAVTERLPAVAATSLPWLVDELEGAFDMLGAVFFGLFMALAPEQHRSGLLRLMPQNLRPRVDALVDEARDMLRGWIGAVAIGMTIVGTLTTIGLYAIGIDEWLVFGAVSAGMEIVPYAGAFLGFLGPFVSALLNGEPRTALLVVLLYVGVQALMMNVINPYLVKRRTDIPASLAIASILLLGRIAGLIGVLAAVPLVAIGIAALRTLPARPLPRLGAPQVA